MDQALRQRCLGELPHFDREQTDLQTTVMAHPPQRPSTSPRARPQNTVRCLPKETKAAAHGGRDTVVVTGDAAPQKVGP